MSKTSRDNKKKEAKTTVKQTKASKKELVETEKTEKSSICNYGRCCKCSHRNKEKKCSILNEYVPRKKECSTGKFKLKN